MIVQVGDKRWKFRFAKIKGDDGRCEHPWQADKTITIKSGQNERDELETILHELLHAADWSKAEWWIEEVGHDIARILYRLGWRKTDPMD